MKVLFVGGTGIISSGCAALALERGMELFILTRGRSRFGRSPEDPAVTSESIGDASVKTVVISAS